MVAWVLLAFFVLVGCSEKKEDSAATTAIASDVTLSMFSVTSSATATTAGALRNDFSIYAANSHSGFTCTSTAKAQYGTSGAPDQMKITVTKIELSSEHHGTKATLFESTSGTEITLSNGQVDLSGLTFASTINQGTYERLTLTVSNEAKIKGCIEDAWEANTSQCTDDSKCDTISAGTYKFCTKSNHDTFDVLAGSKGTNVARTVYSETGNASATGEEVSVPLNTRLSDGSSTPTKTETVDFSFDLVAPVKVGSGTASFPTESKGEKYEEPKPVTNELKLTIVVDMNTLLKFEGNTRNDGSHPFSKVSGLATADLAYWHTGYLPDVLMAFVGTKGDIHGYRIDSCYDFNDSASDQRATRMWLTVIYDSDNNIIGGSMTPYDDAGFILLKGSLNSSSNTNATALDSSGTTYRLNFSGNYGNDCLQTVYQDGFSFLTSVNTEGVITDKTKMKPNATNNLQGTDSDGDGTCDQVTSNFSRGNFYYRRNL